MFDVLILKKGLELALILPSEMGYFKLGLERAVMSNAP